MKRKNRNLKRENTQMHYEIIRLIDKPNIKEQAAQWFHEKWNIPLEAYIESMEDCLNKRNSIPQWCSFDFSRFPCLIRISPMRQRASKPVLPA